MDTDRGGTVDEDWKDSRRGTRGGPKSRVMDVLREDVKTVLDGGR